MTQAQVPIPDHMKTWRTVVDEEVALPYFLWRVDLDVLDDRKLRLAELTVLRLINAGIRSTAEISELMGMTDRSLVQNAVEGLHTQHLIGSDLLGLFLRPRGEAALRQESYKEPRRLTKVKVWHDPYNDRLFFGEGEKFIRQEDLAKQGLRRLPTNGDLDPAELEERFKQIQDVLIESQKDYERELNLIFTGHIDVLQAKATDPEVVFRTARLVVLHEPRDGAIEWLLIRGTGETALADASIVQQLQQLEVEGHIIVPAYELPTDFIESEKDSELSTAIAEGVIELSQELPDTYDFIESLQHRDTMIKAIHEAERELVIISPWLNNNAVDRQLLDEFDRALRRHPSLHIYIGYGYQPEATREPAKLGDERKVISKLRKVSQRHGGRISLLDLGNTHQKILIADDKVAIVTSFNWLSFMPRKHLRNLYLREETGAIFRRKKAVDKLKKVIDRVYTPVKTAGTALT